MCQPKDKGGKRCSVHQAGSKFSMRVAKLKTGADDATVKETFTELTKEGRPLPTPSKEEVEAFIEKKRFATELDPELDAHERKIELSQLARAEKELDSVTGASFHAWKNLRKRVAEKMKAFAVKVRKPVLAFGLAGAVIFGGAGCGAQDAQPSTPTPAPTSTSQPTQAPVDNTKYGDVVALDKVTDSLGEYTHVTISPDDDSLQADPAKYDVPSLEAVGLTQEDALSAQQWASKFIVENSMDSEAVDTADGWNNWVANKSSQFVDPNYPSLLNNPVEGSDRSGIIFNNPNNYMPALIRDGKPRISDMTVTTESVSGHAEDGGGYAKVVMDTMTTYRVPEAYVQQKLRDANPGLTDEQLKETVPTYFDGVEEPYSIQSKWTYYLSKTASGWQISGYFANNTALD